MPVRSSKANPKAHSGIMPNHNQGRPERQLQAGATDYVELLITQQGLKAVTRWFLQRDVLPQFKWARKAAQHPALTHTWRELTPLPG